MRFIKAHPVWSVVVLALCLLAGSIVGFAGTKRISPLSWGWYGQINAPGGVAIGGYDPVSYHRSGAAAKGDPRYAVDWRGGRWLFATPESKALFEANQEKYTRNSAVFAPMPRARALPRKRSRTRGESNKGGFTSSTINRFGTSGFRNSSKA